MNGRLGACPGLGSKVGFQSQLQDKLQNWVKAWVCLQVDECDPFGDPWVFDIDNSLGALHFSILLARSVAGRLQ